MKLYIRKIQIYLQKYTPLVLRVFRIILSVSKVLTKTIGRKVKKILSLIIHKKTLKIIGVLFGLGVVGIIALFLYFWTQLEPIIDDIENQQIESSQIYDRTNNSISSLSGELLRIKLGSLGDVPQHTIDAIIVTEDDAFYGHFGIDVAGVVRSAWQNVVQGRVAQGGSTITQQFIKNRLLISNEGIARRTIGRKIKEVILAIELELKYSKDEILKLYLDEIPYGSNIYGIRTATRKYFDKSVQDLTLGESALLAALPKAPSYYLNNPEELEQRRRYVLRRMRDLGYVSDQKYQDAVSEEVVASRVVDEIRYGHHIAFEVKQQLEQMYGANYVATGGLRVTTTIDPRIQSIAEQAVQKYAETNESRYRATNAAVIVIDHNTGEILAMVGSKDYFNQEIDGNVNVTMRPRQPGSSFKPFVYAQALNEGYTLDTVLYDVPTEFREYCDWQADQNRGFNGRSCYHPQNYNNKFVGPQTLKEALAQSRNVPAVKLLYLTGIEDVIDLAQNMGITTLDNVRDDQLSLVLGSGEVTLLEASSAYGVFATQGMYREPILIREVRDNQGNVIDSFSSEAERVLDADVANNITHALSVNAYRAPTFGVSNILNIPGIASAAKTGTNQDYKDAWTIGYTPSITVGVWVGNNNGDLMRPGAGGAAVAGPIWNTFLREAYKEPEQEKQGQFTLPKPATESFPSIRTQQTSKHILNGEVDALFPRSILYFVDKNNPRGNPPGTPQNSDILYENFERSVRNWAGVEYDIDEFSSSNGVVEILSPGIGESILYGISPSVEFSVVSPKKIKSIEVYLNRELVSSYSDYTTETASLSVPLPIIQEGQYEVAVKVITEDTFSHTASRLFVYSLSDSPFPRSSPSDNIRGNSVIIPSTRESSTTNRETIRGTNENTFIQSETTITKPPERDDS